MAWTLISDPPQLGCDCGACQCLSEPLLSGFSSMCWYIEAHTEMLSDRKHNWSAAASHLPKRITKPCWWHGGLHPSWEWALWHRAGSDSCRVISISARADVTAVMYNLIWREMAYIFTFHMQTFGMWLHVWVTSISCSISPCPLGRVFNVDETWHSVSLDAERFVSERYFFIWTGFLSTQQVHIL